MLPSQSAGRDKSQLQSGLGSVIWHKKKGEGNWKMLEKMI